MSLRTDNKDLLKLKVDVFARDDANFMEMALLVDKPDFLRLLPQIRKEYGVELIVSPEDYDKNFDLVSDDSKTHRINFSKYANPKLLREYTNEHVLGDKVEDGLDIYQAFDTEMLLLCYIFKRPPIFDSVCRYAVLSGEVNDVSYRTTKVIVTDENNTLISVSELGLPHVVIAVSPNSTDRELLQAGREAKTLYKTDKRLSFYKPRTDLASKIRNYRDWYWDHLSGMGYVEIAKKWADKDDVDFTAIDDNRILKGVSYYTKLLSH